MRHYAKLLRATLAISAFLAMATAGTASSQPWPPHCDAFGLLKTELQQRARAVRASIEHKAERKDICAAVQRFYAAEGKVLKFLEDNKTSCGIADHTIKAIKGGHERNLKFRTAVCTEAPATELPPPPSPGQ